MTLKRCFTTVQKPSPPSMAGVLPPTSLLANGVTAQCATCGDMISVGQAGSRLGPQEAGRNWEEQTGQTNTVICVETSPGLTLQSFGCLHGSLAHTVLVSKLCRGWEDRN